MADAAQAALDEKARKKAEVRKRLEAQAKAQKQGEKKGFLTPERKKRLRNFLMKKIAEDMKREQEKKAEERRKFLASRIGNPSHGNVSAEAELQRICKEYHDRIYKLEETKYDLESKVRQKDYELNEMTIQVNDLKGKFVKPTLKKVSKYDTSKVAKYKTSPQDVDFRAGLKSTGISKFALKEETGEGGKPEWAGKKEGDVGDAPAEVPVEDQLAEE